MQMLFVAQENNFYPNTPTAWSVKLLDVKSIKANNRD